MLRRNGAGILLERRSCQVVGAAEAEAAAMTDTKRLDRPSRRHLRAGLQSGPVEEVAAEEEEVARMSTLATSCRQPPLTVRSRLLSGA